MVLCLFSRRNVNELKQDCIIKYVLLIKQMYSNSLMKHTHKTHPNRQAQSVLVQWFVLESDPAFYHLSRHNAQKFGSHFHFSQTKPKKNQCHGHKTSVKLKGMIFVNLLKFLQCLKGSTEKRLKVIQSETCTGK